jgi:predicted aspartyl protease
LVIAGLLVAALPGAHAADVPASPVGTPVATGTASTADSATAARPGDTSQSSPIVVTAPEPRYVAPTRRDQIGRIWAPVFINGKGPFRLVLDSGASSSGITAPVAAALGLSPDAEHKVLLRGIVGTTSVPVVSVQSFDVGDVSRGKLALPIMPDALGGADGILGTDRMDGQRILIEFHHDLITIDRSQNQRAPAGYLTIPFRLANDQLVVTNASVGNVRVQAVIDTGAQVTIANLALRRALKKQSDYLASTASENAQKTGTRINRPDQIEDETKATQTVDSAESPPIMLGTGRPNGTIKINTDRMNFADMNVFEHWHMTSEPALLVGMDTLGRLDILIIDYRRHELQMHLDGADFPPAP